MSDDGGCKDQKNIANPNGIISTIAAIKVAVTYVGSSPGMNGPGYTAKNHTNAMNPKIILFRFNKTFQFNLFF